MTGSLGGASGQTDRFSRVGRRQRTRAESITAVTLAAGLVAALSGGCGEDERARPAGALRITVADLSPGRAHYRAPRSIPAGLVRITLENKGKERRKAQLVRILGNHSISEARRARRPFPKWLYTEGGVGFTDPGETNSAIQRLDPGRYYITGTYGERGTVAPLRVVGERSDAKLPETAGVIRTNEYSFTNSGLKAGANTVEFSNDGFEPHHAVVAPVQAGSSVRALREFLRGKGKIPVGKVVDLDKAQETSVIERGQRQVVRLRLKPGKYALLCFVPDRKGGPPHVAKGMVDAVTVR